VERVVCGLRDDDGRVRALEEISVRAMPGMVKDLQFWVSREPRILLEIIIFNISFLRKYLFLIII
jgi:hypothetical protein